MPALLNWLSHPGHQCVRWGGQLEGVDELGDLLEVGAQADELVRDIFQADDIAADVLLHQLVGVDGHSLGADFPVHFLVDQLLYDLCRWLPVCYVILHSA